MKKQIATITSVVILLLAMLACNAPTIPTQAPPIATVTSTIPAPTSAATHEKVTFKDGDLTLEGFLFKPAGDGPFPALIWNHGSEQYPDQGPEFPGIASVFVPAGYVLFAPVRRGQGQSQGEYISDSTKQERQAHGNVAAAQLLVKLMETEQLDDQLAGLDYLKSLPYVDQNHLGVVGCSYGGIQTLLAAERGAGFKAAVALSPAAESWNGNKPLQDRLIKAVSSINIPVFIIHPAKDVSLEPGTVLSKEFERLGKPYQFKIYPPIGTDAQQGHCFGGAQGNKIWQADVLEFFSKYLR